MFTGLVEDVGTVVALAPRGQGRELRIRTAIPLSEVAIGDSIAVNGACLTVEALTTDRFTVLAGRETLARTTVGDAQVGDTLHLERAVRVGDRLGGHLVQGHVDGLCRVLRTESAEESLILWLAAPEEHARYIASKGSVTLDGVSLTVNEIEGTRFRVNLVPHTVAVTTLGRIRPGAAVNLEVDVVAKYVARLLGLSEPGLSLETLKANGFVP